MPENKISSEKVAVIKRDDFIHRYANATRFESTVYDLKIVFGDTDLRSATNEGEVLVQHTAITLPWALVKTVIYFLEGNLAIHEAANGPVHVPPSQVPPPYEPLDRPGSEHAKKAVQVLREAFIAKNFPTTKK